jgi:hypothetical protein
LSLSAKGMKPTTASSLSTTTTSSASNSSAIAAATTSAASSYPPSLRRFATQQQWQQHWQQRTHSLLGLTTALPLQPLRLAHYIDSVQDDVSVYRGTYRMWRSDVWPAFRAHVLTPLSQARTAVLVALKHHVSALTPPARRYPLERSSDGLCCLLLWLLLLCCQMA